MKERGDLSFIQEKVKLAMKITFVIGLAAAYWTNLYYSTYQYYVV